MKKSYFLLLILPFCNTPAVHAESQLKSHVVIAAVQTESTTATGDDYVVIHNPTDDDININGWKLQYRSAAATGSAAWTTKVSFKCPDDKAVSDCTLAAHKSIVASTFNIEGVHSFLFSTGFSSVGGQLRIVQPVVGDEKQFIAVDMVGYGTAVESEGKPALAPERGKVLLRKTSDDSLVDTDDNQNDFSVGCYKLDISAMPVGIPCETIGGSGGADVSDGQDGTTQYSRVEINELLPDPVGPRQDSSDEFIELYNPNSNDVNLEGYSIQAGANFKYRYVFGSQVIPSGGYIVVYSSETDISLSNSGTAVRLTDPNGNILSSAAYGVAKQGQSWAVIDGTWQWTTSLTPGEANKPTPVEAVSTKTIAVTAKAIKPAKTTIPKNPEVPRAPVKKVSSPARTSTPKANSKKSSNSSAAQNTSQSTPFWLYGALGAGLLGYAGYEYRENITRFGRRIALAIGGRRTTNSSQQLPDTTPQMD